MGVPPRDFIRREKTGEAAFMLFKNANIFTPGGFRRGSFHVEDGRFSEILPDVRYGEGVDLGGARVIPGLVDIHTHGCAGRDFSDGSLDGLREIAAFEAAHGVTGFVPTSMTLPEEQLSAAFATARALYADPPEGCARVLGIHMEGPFFSDKKKGAQNPAYLRDPDPEMFKRLYDGCGGLIRIVDVAPELPGARGFAREASRWATVSVAHTDAGYEDAAAVFDAGASHVTHLFNAMPPIHHRRPGVIGAACERDGIAAELICDGLHIHPSVVRMAFRLFPGRICLISDSIRCCGMPDGEYELGGQPVFLKDDSVRMADGTIAGAASHLYRDLQNAVRFGIPMEEAITSATLLPARAIGADDRIGSIEKGKRADFVVCGDRLELRSVYMDGISISGEDAASAG